MNKKQEETIKNRKTDMFAEERREEIAKQLNETKRVRVSELAEQFAVSEDLIRKDLAKMEKEGRLCRVYGGAVPAKENLHRYSSVQRQKTDLAQRHMIAARACAMIHDGMTVFLDTSVTSVLIAEEIRKAGLAVTVVTNMIAVMEELLAAEHTKLILIGGVINPTRDAFWSAAAIRSAAAYRYDLALIGTVGADLETGRLYTYEEEDGLLKRTVMEHADYICILCESYKLNEIGDYVYASLREADEILMERSPDQKEAEAAAGWQVRMR